MALPPTPTLDGTGLTLDPGTVNGILNAMDENAMIGLLTGAHSSKDQAEEGMAQSMAGTGSKIGGG